jgi:hypothetical protein
VDTRSDVPAKMASDSSVTVPLVYVPDERARQRPRHAARVDLEPRPRHA